MPAAFNGGTAGCPVVTSPRQQRCANSSSKRQARTPQTGLLRNVLATKLLVRFAAKRTSQPHPLCIDTAFSQRLLSRRFFRVAQIRKEHHRLAFSRSTMTFLQRIGSNRRTTRLFRASIQRKSRITTGIQTQPRQSDYSAKPPSRYKVYSFRSPI